jgi:hypothetical protein
MICGCPRADALLYMPATNDQDENQEVAPELES